MENGLVCALLLYRGSTRRDAHCPPRAFAVPRKTGTAHYPHTTRVTGDCYVYAGGGIENFSQTNSICPYATSLLEPRRRHQNDLRSQEAQNGTLVSRIVRNHPRWAPRDKDDLPTPSASVVSTATARARNAARFLGVHSSFEPTRSASRKRSRSPAR